MRLRQAHAALQAGNLLAAQGFEFYPRDHDHPDLVDPPDDDCLTGYREINDPDHPADQTRTYHLDVIPDPSGCFITAHLVYGYSDEAELLLQQRFLVRDRQLEEYDLAFLNETGPELARLVAEAIEEHEKPYIAAYLARSGQK